MIRSLGVLEANMKRKAGRSALLETRNTEPVELSAVPAPSPRRSKWTEVPAGEATYWKVRCNTCGSEWVKASERNVVLCKMGHHRGSHFGHPMDYSIVPMKRNG